MIIFHRESSLRRTNTFGRPGRERERESPLAPRYRAPGIRTRNRLAFSRNGLGKGLSDLWRRLAMTSVKVRTADSIDVSR